MPRSARRSSETGYLHVITRGIGRQLLFEDAHDYNYYVWLLEKYSERTGVAVCAYCLMQNHVHLLLCDKEGAAADFMKRIGVSYSYYFNHRYERTGHLFQDRYKSEPIKDDSQLLSAFKYILRNPQQAGVCSAEDYPWSSYKLYGKASSFVDTTLLCGMLGSFNNYARFIAEGGAAPMQEYEPVRVGESRAESILAEVLGTTNGTVLQTYDKARRNEAISKLRKAGLSIRQIERYTGVSRGVIQFIEW